MRLVQDVSAEPSPDVAGEGHAWNAVAIHCIALQQVVVSWLLSG